MAKKAKLPPRPPGGFHYPWYLRDWLDALEVTQAKLERMTELSKATVSDLVNDKLQYSQTHIDRIAWELNILPHELLLPPARAFMLRQLEKAHREVEANPAQGLPPEPDAVRLWRRK